MQIVTLDIESYWDSEVSLQKMTYIEYARHPEVEIFGASVKINQEETVWYRPEELRKFLKTLPPEYVLVGHNIAFDAVFLAELGFQFQPARYFDVQSAARAIYGASVESFSLDSLSKLLLGDQKISGVLQSTKGKHWDEMTRREQISMAVYCCQDTNLTYELFEHMYVRLPLEEQQTMHLTLKMYLEPRMVINENLLAHTIVEAEEARNKMMKKAGEILSCSTAKALKILSSNNQFVDALENLDPPVEVLTKPSPSVENKQIPAIAKNDLEFQALAASSREDVATLCAARLNAKSNIIKTRAERLLSDDLPYSRTFLNYAGALSTLRDSGGQKNNKQNFPRGSNLRAAIRAPKGYKLLVIDSSNIELRSMFYISGQTDKLELIRKGEDLYIDAATSIYDAEKEEISKYQRSVGKVQMLSLQYGSGWAKMQHIFAAGIMGPSIVFDDEEAKKIWNKYRESNPQVVNYWERCSEMISYMHKGLVVHYPIPYEKTPFLTTRLHKLYSHSCNLHLHFKDLYKSSGKKKGSIKGWTYKERNYRAKIYGAMLTGRVNQHFARNIVFHQLNQIAERYPLTLRVHDEGVFLIPDSPTELEEAKAFALEQFSTPPPFAPNFPCAGEAVISSQYEKPG